MLLFLHHHQRYLVNRSREEVEAKLRWIVNRRWEDYSIGLVGKLHADGSFIMKGKWPLMLIRWFDNNPGSVEGSIHESSDKTMICITSKPNTVLLILSYLFLGITLFIASGIENLIPFTKTIKLAASGSFTLILAWMAIYFRNDIRKQFEELMQVKELSGAKILSPIRA